MRKLIVTILMLVGISLAQHQATMQWTASTSQGIRYRVYRTRTNGGPYNLLKGNVTALQYQDTTVKGGLTYYYIVRAFWYPSCKNNFSKTCESVNSNQIKAVVPK